MGKFNRKNVALFILELSPFHSRAESLEEQRRTYWEQADFGYIKKKIDTMKYICKRKTKGKVTQYLLLIRHSLPSTRF